MFKLYLQTRIKIHYLNNIGFERRIAIYFEDNNSFYFVVFSDGLWYLEFSIGEWNIYMEGKYVREIVRGG